MLNTLSNILTKLLSVIILIMLSVFCNAQSEVEKKSTDDEKKPTLIQLIQADVANNHRSTNNQILIGNVIFKHDEAFLYCDSAYLNKSRNDLEAFGKVHVIESDTINLYGKHLIYNGNTKLAEISREVLLTDPTTNLRTEILFYDRAKQVAYYNTGATIINSDKTLVSKRGIYNLDNKDFDFFIDVVITDPEYVLEADTVFYNSNTEIARTISKTIIHNGENTIYCEKGIYDSKVKKSFLKTNVEIHYNEYIVFCDSAYYNESIEYAEAYKDVITIDTANNVKSWSEYLEYNKIGEYAFISEDAVARAVNEGDTIFLFADTLFAKFNNETETIDKAFAYNNTKIFSNDYQSACDSLVYYHSDSIAVLYNSPALWSGNNQITGDSITFIVKNETLEKITATPNGFIISEDSLGAYNQIKGKLIDLFFENNKLDNVFVNGNSEILYFLREDDGTMIGPYYIISSDSRIFFNENEISKLINLSNPKSELTPEEKSVKEKEILTGFKNKFDEIPEKPTNNKFFR